jgi:xanthine phosphoribosyltransferase
MQDFPNIPVIPPQDALKIISASPISKAQKLLTSSIITQARIFPFRYPKTHKDLLTIDVSHFLNHRVNTKLINAIAEEMAAQISLFTPDLILTAPSTGNFLALATAAYLPGIPDVIYTPKGASINQDNAYQTRSHSFVHGKKVKLMISTECLPPLSKVAVCDDFLDTGETIINLIDIITQANARVVTAFFVIEKPFGGRETLTRAGIPPEAVVSLIKIESLRPGKLKLEGFDYWFELIRK